jgi:hypothetical protein
VEFSQGLVVDTDGKIAVIDQLMYRKKGIIWLTLISDKAGK